MTEIKIQEIAHGSDAYCGHGSDFTQEVTVEELSEAYTRFNQILEGNGRTIIPQKIEDKLFEEGIIGPSNGSGVYFFRNCLIENKFMPTVFDGCFHLVAIAGEPAKH